MIFDAAAKVADAVLSEGYVLYPYTASAAKNQVRWQFGVIAPRPPGDEGEPWFSTTECLIEPSGAAARLFVRVRCLRPRRTATGWLEGITSAIDVDAIELGALPLTREIALRPLDAAARLHVEAARVDAWVKVRLRLENVEPWVDTYRADRDAMLERSLVAAHLLLAVENGAFVSLLEPPDHAAATAASCDNRNTWPVLVGDRSDRRLMLSSPIVLYDYPSIAPESRTELCDGAEIDEILSLRILTLTDQEKAEARATDPRARAILDRVESLTPQELAALHGTMRSADLFNPPDSPPPEDAFVCVGDHRITRGSRVRLRPNRRADSMDMFLNDQAATVAGVYRDLDERVYVAVTVDADPAAALHDSFGRFFYFDPAEVEPLDASCGEV